MAISISQKKSTKRAHASKKKDMQTSSTARKSSRSFLGNVALLVFLFVLGFLFFFPVLYMLNQSLKPLNEMYMFPPKLFVQNPTTNNFSDLFRILANTLVPFTRYLFNSLFVVALGSLGHIIIAAMCAYPLAKYKFPGSALISSLIVYSLMFNTTVTMVPNFITVSRLNLIDTYGAIIFPTFASTLGLYLMKNFMEQIQEGVQIFKSSDMEDMSVDVINLGVQFIGAELSDQYKTFENRILEYLGIENLPVEKQERMLTGEVSSNDDKTNLMFESRLLMRERACTEMNELFGLNIEVQKRELPLPTQGLLGTQDATGEGGDDGAETGQSGEKA